MKYDYPKSRLNSEIDKTVKKVRKLHWKYRNLIYISLSVLVSYALLREGILATYLSGFGDLGYLGAFIGGLFFSYALTTPISVAVLFLLSENLNPLIVAFLGAFGAVISDYIIFRFVRDRLLDELKTLSDDLKIKMPRIPNYVKRSKYAKWIIPTIAGFIIASPLPDELAAALFAAVRFDPKKFALISYVSNFLGILAIALASKVV